MTDSTRDAFEAWFTKRRGAGLLSKAITGGYEWVATSEAWETWQAATLAEQERCALICEDASDFGNDSKNTQYVLACDDVADAIRGKA